MIKSVFVSYPPWPSRDYLSLAVEMDVFGIGLTMRRDWFNGHADWQMKSPTEAAWERIQKKISESYAFVSIVTGEWTDWQARELILAFQQGKPVVSIATEPIPERASALHERLNIPLVRGSPERLLEILRGAERTFSYDLALREKSRSEVIKLDFTRFSEEVTRHLLRKPEDMYSLSPRSFEQLVAFLLEGLGYTITLTQQTRDEGVDIFALKKDEVGEFLTVVDCKKFSPSRPVGIEIVRSLYGVLEIQNASHAMVATTSRFTLAAKALEREKRHRISLKAHGDILRWIQRVAGKTQ